MTFRTRLLIAFAAGTAAPLILLAIGVRREMDARLTAQYELRVDALVGMIAVELEREAESIELRLAALHSEIDGDNRLRSGVRGDASERRYLLDYAGVAMGLTGLDMLQIQDETDRIVSSGHFRNEFDRKEPGLVALLAATPGGTALMEARRPEGKFLALVRADSFHVAGTRFTLIGGTSVEPDFLGRLAPDEGLSVSLHYAGGVIRADPGSVTSAFDSAGVAGIDGPTGAAARPPTGDGQVVRRLPIAFLEPDARGGGRVSYAWLSVAHPLSPLRELQRSVDVWFIAAVSVTIVLAMLLAAWLASRISRPITDLARKTALVDLDRLDVEFDTARGDEVGALSRLLAAMTGRLRASASSLREAERRATIGDIARQVNHDIRNGLTPIRNVFRHLSQIERDAPDMLAPVFDERRGTLESSISYLEALASNYARLSADSERRPFQVNPVVEEVIGNAIARGGATVRASLGEPLPAVVGDSMALRRILENIVGNAIDSLPAPGGEVSVSTELISGAPYEPGVRITINDTGCGMDEEQQKRAFDDFFTTKKGGSGLGLSIVKRLVGDLNGSVQLESEGGVGTRVVVELQAVNGQL